MIRTKTLLAGFLGFFLTSLCSAGELDSLVVEGPELHGSLKTRRIGDSINQLSVVPPGNPHLSSDAGFIEALARAGSQGRLGGEGVRSALYALYYRDQEPAGEWPSDLGFYGLEATSIAAADQREDALREIWAKNVRLDRARIHREGLVLVVVWTYGVSRECWEAVNASVAERLAPPGPSSVDQQSRKSAKS